jgi:hypothetical protein
MLTTEFPFSGKFEVLAESYSGDDREALRSFIVLHDVRRFDLACISVICTISDVMSSNAQALGGPRQSDEQPSPFVSTLTVPAEVLCTLTLDARVGDLACSEFSSGHGPAWSVDLAV